MKQFFSIYFIAVLIVAFPNESVSQDLDNTFGINGESIVDINNQVQEVNTVKVQTDGKILVCGNNFTPDEYFVIRQNTNGTLDNTFNTNGVLTFTIPGASVDGGSNTMSLQPDGKILVGGSDYDGTTIGSVVVRINTDGSFDNTFGVNGFAKFSILGSSDIVNSILVLPNGQLYVIGTAYNGTLNEVYIAKLNTDGSFDNTFNTNGKITFSGSTGNNQAILQTDNKIVIGNGSIVQRINTDGSFDSNFGVSGVVTITGINVRSISLLKSNKIIIAGDSIGYFAIARLNTDGTIDNTFGTNGKNIFTPTVLANANNIFRSVAEDTINNNIIAGGYTFFAQGDIGYMSVVEFSPNGTTGNYITINGCPMNTGYRYSQVYSLLIQKDRKIVLAGPEGNASNDDIAVVRLNANFGTFIATGVLPSTEISSGFNIFPNPANQNINVHSVYNIMQIKVIDVLGNEVLNVNDSGNTQIDISSMPKGLYNFVITTDKGTGSKKVSVQ
jgi:uncharacterized delta-60 repeat protein